MYTTNVLDSAPAGIQTGGTYWRHPATGLPFVPETRTTGSYLDRLYRKYGRVRIASISHDERDLEAAGSEMHGADVVIAPTVFARMQNEPSIAAYYEQKVSEFFDATPRMEAGHAERGLNYKPCGVVIHMDGTVTYICGDTSYGDGEGASGARKYFCEQRMDTLEEQSMLTELTCPLPMRTDVASETAAALEDLLGGSIA